MCDVTRHNFRDVYGTVEKVIQEAAFVALDGEFTGLSTSITYEPTLFDTPEIRYKKLKKSLSQFTLCQFGLSAFVPDPEKENRYVAYTFNFYVFPKPFGPIDTKFACQASALEFLTSHNFDFNKFIKDGIPYMNSDQEKALRSHYKANTIQYNMSSALLRQIDELYVNPSLQKIDEFLKTDLNNDTLEMPSIPFGLPLFLLLKSIEKRFSNISCSIDDQLTLIVKKILDVEEKISYDPLYERLLEDAVGMARILRLLASAKKPVIGHNFLSDIILMYERFFSHLPDSYENFKNSLHELFPVIYDTKHMAFALRKEFKNLFEDTSLEHIYNLFAKSSNSPSFHHRVCTPQVIHADMCKSYETRSALHEAGYDAYLTGFIFIRLAHLIATKGIKITEETPLEFADHLFATNIYQDCVNIPRAAVRYLNFSGADPPVVLPERFIVRLRTGKNITAAQVAQDFLLFGSVDVKLKTPTEAVVAVSYRRRARDVIKAFSKSKTYHAVKYDWWIHSEEAIKLYWFGGIGTLSLLTATTAYLMWRYR